MKKNGWLSLVLVLFFLAAWGKPGQVQAGERDTLLLLNLLKKKGVITEEEFLEELMKEVQTQAKQEKEERKQEIKEVAQKGDFLPGYLKGVKFGTTIFGEWRMRSEDKGGTTTNEFLLEPGLPDPVGQVELLAGLQPDFGHLHFPRCRRQGQRPGNQDEIRLCRSAFLGYRHRTRHGSHALGHVRLLHLALPGPGQTLPG